MMMMMIIMMMMMMIVMMMKRCSARVVPNLLPTNPAPNPCSSKLAMN